MTVAPTITISAPFFLIDVAALFPELFVLGESPLGGGDVLGGTDIITSDVTGEFVLGDSLLGGPDVLGGGTVLVDTPFDVLESVSVANDFFPPFPRVIVTTVGIAASPTTGLLTAICGQVFAFVPGSQVQFSGVTARGTTFSLNAVYSGATNVFIG